MEAAGFVVLIGASLAVGIALMSDVFCDLGGEIVEGFEEEAENELES